MRQCLAEPVWLARRTTVNAPARAWLLRVPVCYPAPKGEGIMILRKWESRIRAEDEAAYIAYIEDTGAADYAGTDGNLGFQILLQRHADATCTVTTLSWWRDLAATKAFAGEDYGKSRYYAEDARYPARMERGSGAFRGGGGSAGRVMGDDFELVRGGGNVFSDFGHANAEAEQLKATLASQIIRVLDARGLTVRAAAELTGTAAADDAHNCRFLSVISGS
jgi:heme-degrading monooxygenase HmoA